MAVQSFGPRKRLDRRSETLEPRAGELLNADDLHKIRDTESTASTRSTSRGQHVIRAGGIVARCLR